MTSQPEHSQDGIAIIGLAGRFPGAANVDEFWRNLCAGVESVTHFTREDLAAVGVTQDLLDDPNYVRARSVLSDVDLFDAAFFGYTPKEAASMDPQQRLFLEGCWHALEDAACDPERFDGPIGVFAGAYMGTYLLHNLCTSREFIETLLSFKKVGAFQTFLGNDKDYLTTRTAYKLNLKGPAVTIQTACSTSLVAVCQACQSLKNHECDLALSGGITITLPQKKGYLYQEGGMVSPDGHCRAFDANAQGTVFGSGMGIVVLKRLGEALRDGDQIYAVIKGWALNNDGSSKVSYTAPSIDGQAEVIALAQAVAGFPADTITYVEAHGTGTPVGDPIEIAALTQAFRGSTDAKGFCAIGAVKTNIGHLDVAAGVAGLIKTTLALKHAQIPPSLHFTKPNPRIDFENSPFYVNTRLTPWEPKNDHPCRAGVSSFGVGGTNAHVVLEEPPPPRLSTTSRAFAVLPLSAKTDDALACSKGKLAAYLGAAANANLADAAFTLQVGRRQFTHRLAVVGATASEITDALEKGDRNRVFTKALSGDRVPVVFLFPGQGAQYFRMGARLYEVERVYREAVDRCAEALKADSGFELRDALLAPADESTEHSKAINETRFAQPALFTVEYALAQLWLSWGVRPAAMLGHSVGEYTAGCLAGVMTVEDALRLIASRAALVQALPRGGMLAVKMAERDLEPMVREPLAFAAVNAPTLCVVSGPFDALEALESELKERSVAARRLQTSHAFHSSMMDAALEPFRQAFQGVKLQAPTIPYVSNVTGDWIRDDQTTDVEYWVSHVRRTVRFADGLSTLMTGSEMALLEVGPGNTLTTLARQHPDRAKQAAAVETLPATNRSDEESLAVALARLWVAGVDVDWCGVNAGQRRQRVSLPGYAFDRKRHWIEPDPGCWVQNDPPGQSEPPAQVVVPQSITVPDNPTAVAPPVEGIAKNMSAEPKRTDRLIAELRSMLYELSGAEISEADCDSSFLELGFDSLFLTQARQQFQKQFGVKLTSRQLQEDLSSVRLLAGYIDGKLPAEAFPAPAEAPAVAVAGPVPSPQPSTPPPGGRIPDFAFPAPCGILALAQGQNSEPGLIDRVMAQQLQAFNQLVSQQFAALRGASASGPHASPQSSSAVPAAPVSSQPASIPSSPADQPGPVGSKATVQSRDFGPFRTVKRSPAGEFTDQQRQHLEAISEAWTRRTAKSKEWAQRHRRPLADPRSLANFRSAWKEMVYQVVVQRGSGARLWDIDGNEYIDVTMGFGVNLLGHSPAFVIDAINDQLRQGVQIGPQSPLAGEAAELFCELTGVERATFCNTGSEAVMAALRVARTVTGRNRVAYFSGDYHGMFDEVLLHRVTVAGRTKSIPTAPGIPANLGDNVMVLEYGEGESLRILEQEASDLAAVLVEPVQSRHPSLQPIEFLHALRALCDRTGAVLIFDEVITGFRAHPAGAQGVFGVRADLATYGKVVGGGLPIGVLGGKAAFMDALDGGFWQYGDDSTPEADVTFFAGTFVRHPLALAVARAVLKHLKDSGPELQSALNRRTDEFVGNLNAFLQGRGIPWRVDHFSSQFRFHFPNEWQYAPLYVYHLLQRGVYFRESHQNCFLSTAHTEEDLNRVASAVCDSVMALEEGGFLGSNAGGHVPGCSTGRGDGLAAGGLTDATHSGEPDGRGDAVVAPLTAAQQEIWLACQMGKDVARAFNESFTGKFEGPLDLEAFRCALREVIARHDAFQTTFLEDGASQLIHSRPMAIEPSFEDWSDLPENERSTRIQGIAREEANRDFDLSKGPLVQVRLICVSNELHLLVFTGHHLVFDGWSSNVVWTELARVYSGIVENRPPGLSPAPSFGEYAQEEVRMRASGADREDEAWWLAQFRNAPRPIELPRDHKIDPRRERKAGAEQIPLDPGLLQSVKKAASAKGCTSFALMFATFQLMLYRLSGQTDFAIGIFDAGQARVGSDHLVGHCVNLLPIRCRLDGRGAFAGLLALARNAVLDASDHGSITHGRLLEQLKLPRQGGRSPLINVVFNLEPNAGVEAIFQGLRSRADRNRHGYIQFELFWNINDAPGEPHLDIEYDCHLFSPGTMQRWGRYFIKLLGSVVENPKGSLDALELMDEKERRTVLVDWNSTDASYPEDQPLDELIASQARSTPDVIAAAFEDSYLTYGQLDAQANQLASLLVDVDVGVGSRVGVHLERSLDMLIAVLAVMKAGAAYVPLDPGFPKERLAFMVEDSGIQVLLTQSALQTGAAELCASRVLDLDAERPALQKRSSKAVRVHPGGEAVAYVIYTSGSTGRPKGVEIPHRALVNFLCSMRREPGMGRKDVLLAVTTLSFDISGLELFLPLLTGARVVIAPREVAMDVQRLAGLIQRSGATVMQATPSMWRLLVNSGWPGNPKLKVLCGGEALPEELAEQLHSRCTELWNVYGPTETTIWSTLQKLEPGQPVTVGRPIANTQVYILSDDLRPLPVGAVGTLFIGGDGLALGYLNQPELTATKFIRNPFGSSSDSRIYSTGDLARYLPDGRIECLGRRDSQVKLRGFRVELEEIETVLRGDPSIQDCAVGVIKGPSGEDSLVAYLVQAEAVSIAVGRLQAMLRQRLPAYMVPNVFIPIPELPLTPNGKIDRRSLCGLGGQKLGSERVFTPPETDLEKQICALWKEILGVDRVGLDDDFFELGGHSVLAMRVIMRLRDALGMILPLGIIFEEPQARALAERIETVRLLRTGAREVASPAGEDQAEIEI